MKRLGALLSICLIALIGGGSFPVISSAADGHSPDYRSEREYDRDRFGTGYDRDYHARYRAADPVFHLYNHATDDHLYTMSQNERDRVLRNLRQFREEGVAFYAFREHEPGTEPVHRFYDPATGRHLYLLRGQPGDRHAGGGNWRPEGTAFWAFADPRPGTVPVFTFIRRNGSQVMTSDRSEARDLSRSRSGLRQEDIFYVLPAE